MRVHPIAYLLDFIWSDTVAVFAFFIAVFHIETSIWILAYLLFSIILHYVIFGLCLGLQSLKNYRDFEVFLKDSQNEIIKEVNVSDLQEEIPEELKHQTNFNSTLSNTFIRRNLGLSRPFKKVKILEKYSLKPPFPYMLKAFGNFVGTSFIVLPEIPKKLGLLEKYKLYHELAHIGSSGVWLSTVKYRKAISAPFLIFLTITISGFNTLSIVCICIILWQLYLSFFILDEGLSELQAESMSLNQFSKDDFSTIVKVNKLKFESSRTFRYMIKDHVKNKDQGKNLRFSHPPHFHSQTTTIIIILLGIIGYSAEPPNFMFLAIAAFSASLIVFLTNSYLHGKIWKLNYLFEESLSKKGL